MYFCVQRIGIWGALAALAFAGTPCTARAQAYQVDCAILLCLSGGWPASAPCARAKAEFIRRITPWPVEPPLQIWRCPMRSSNEGSDPAPGDPTLIDIRSGVHGQPSSEPPALSSTAGTPAPGAHFRIRPFRPALLPEDRFLRRTRDQADIDIRDPAFDFVRSIRVFHVRFARQRESGRHGDCNRSAYIALGTYGPQGSFSWRPSSPGALPAAHKGLRRWGETCPTVNHRSVFVEWRATAGDYGFEQVNY